MPIVNSFINGVDSLNTSLLLAVQRLAKIAEESSKEIPQEGKDDGVNQSDSGRYVMFTKSVKHRTPFTLKSLRASHVEVSV